MLRLLICVALGAAACTHSTRYPAQPAAVNVPVGSGGDATSAPPPSRSDSEYPPCTGAPAPASVEAAKAAFRSGQAAFNQGDYAKAVQDWRLAYQYDCTAHALLLNLSRAQELMGDRPAAARSLGAYLERRPDDPDRSQIERRIQVLEGR